jgi:diguanylate cyclase (GGDEF)-like protein
MFAFHQVELHPRRRATDLETAATQQLHGLRGSRRALGALAAVTAVVAIAWLDAIVPSDIALVLLYLVPIAACGWWLGGRVTVLVAVAAGVAFLVSDLGSRTPASLSVSLWHAFTTQIVFLALGGAVARVRLGQDHLAEANRRLSEHLEQESLLARTDARTGLPNVRAFLDHLDMEVARRRRDGRPLAVAYLDIDNFKQVNDIYGHAAGDDLLARIGEAIREAVRAGDVFARVGGDEFAVAFAETGPGDVQTIAQRLAARIRALGAYYPKAQPDCSIGIACFLTVPADPEAIVHCADAAMYRAKQQGKGCIVVSDEDAVEWVPEAVTQPVRVGRPAAAAAPATADADPHEAAGAPDLSPRAPATDGRGAN